MKKKQLQEECEGFLRCFFLKWKHIDVQKQYKAYNKSSSHVITDITSMFFR